MDHQQTHRYHPPPPRVNPYHQQTHRYHPPPPSVNPYHQQTHRYHPPPPRVNPYHQQTHGYYYPPPPMVNPYHQLRPPVTAQILEQEANARSIFHPKCKSLQDIIAREEINAYHGVVEERDTRGFDVPPPSIKGYKKGVLMPVVLDQKKVAHKVKIFAELALMHFNYREALRTKLVFLKVVEANYEVENGYMYYITFDAKDPSAGDGCILTFQAKVWDGISKIEVQLVEPKFYA